MYPSTSPHINVNTTHMTADDKEKLVLTLNSEAGQMIGNPMIEKEYVSLIIGLYKNNGSVSHVAIRFLFI